MNKSIVEQVKELAELQKQATPQPWAVSKKYATTVVGADGFGVLEVDAPYRVLPDWESTGAKHWAGGDNKGITYVDCADSEGEKNAALVAAACSLNFAALSDLLASLPVSTVVGGQGGEEMNDPRIQAISSSLATFRSDFAYRTSSDLGYWVCTARDLVEALKEARSRNEALTQQRDYGRDIINDMTLEAGQATQKIAALEQQLSSGIVLVSGTGIQASGVTYAYVQPSTTTSQPGYYTPIISGPCPVGATLCALPAGHNGPCTAPPACSVGGSQHSEEEKSEAYKAACDAERWSVESLQYTSEGSLSWACFQAGYALAKSAPSPGTTPAGKD